MNVGRVLVVGFGPILLIPVFVAVIYALNALCEAIEFVSRPLRRVIQNRRG